MRVKDLPVGRPYLLSKNLYIRPQAAFGLGVSPRAYPGRVRPARRHLGALIWIYNAHYHLMNSYVENIVYIWYFLTMNSCIPSHMRFNYV